MNPFNFFRRAEPAWFPVGLMSSFPETGSDDEQLRFPRDCKSDVRPGCKVFKVPKEDTAEKTEVSLTGGGDDGTEAELDLKDQVLVFRHRGKMHAVDHVSCLSLTPFCND